MYLLDNVRVLQAFEERDLSDCGARYSIVFLLESDLFEGDDLSSDFVLSFVHYTIGALSELLKFLVSINV